MLHATYDRTIYCTLNEALLSYKKRKIIINPCNPYAWNKVINKKGMKILFYIDNLIISHI